MINLSSNLDYAYKNYDGLFNVPFKKKFKKVKSNAILVITGAIKGVYGIF